MSMSEYRGSSALRATFYQHDDRGDDRVSNQYNMPPKGDRGRRRPWGSRRQNRSQRAVDDEGDVSMGNDGEPSLKHSRMAPYMVGGNRRRGGGGGGGGHYKSRNRHNNNNVQSGGGGTPFYKQSRDGWYRVIIPFAKQLDKAFILKSITDACHVSFAPYQFTTDGKSASFVVETYDVARAIERVSNQIQTPNGFKMKITVRPGQPPGLILNEVVLEKIKLAMSRRFDTDTNRLDLSTFHQDPDLKREGIYAALHRSGLLFNIVKIIEDNVPLLHVLDLSGNGITTLGPLKTLATRVRGIQVLILRNNKIHGAADLDAIKEFQLQELVLDGNPLCDQFRDQTAYVSAVRQRFPKILRLDGQELPPQYGFGLENETSLPPSQGSFFANDSARDLAPEFLKQYYSIYDSDNRQPLLDAYHDQATFSMTSLATNKGGWKASSLSNYAADSRNLLNTANTNSTAKRTKLLRQGKLSVVSSLCDLPKTQHDPSSFSIDTVYTGSNLITITSVGVFKEVDSRQSNIPVRAFCRLFMLVPHGAGFCIINDMLYITNATTEQAKVAFKVPAPTPSPSPVPPPVAAVPVTVAPTPEQQQQMVLTFSQQSGMNTDWSVKCLIENEWDFEKAAAVFQELNRQNKIPPQAFQK